jgi:hypothetical protein
VRGGAGWSGGEWLPLLTSDVVALLDIDAVVLHRDHVIVRQALADWDLWVADPSGTLQRWVQDSCLDAGVHELWCRRSASEPWSLQLMLDTADGEDWVYRRDPRIRRAVTSMSIDLGGVPVIAPEVQLLWKSSQPRAKDDWDFEVLRPLLTGDQGRWLADALDVVAVNHPWRWLLPEGARA